VQWKAAYLLAAVGVQVGFYGSLGILASFAVRRPHTPRKRLIRIVAVPAVVIAATIVIRLFRLGHLPVLANVIVPLGACTTGVVVGLIGRFRGWGVTAGVTVCVAAAVMWGWTRGVPSGLAQATRADLQRLVEAGPGLPDGDARFAALWRTALAGVSPPANANAVLRNRAAILALGIAVGHERLARFAGLERNDELVRAAAQLRQGASLRGREDWSRHYALSAALAVLESPFFSDAGGLVKEQLDALG